MKSRYKSKRKERQKEKRIEKRSFFNKLLIFLIAILILLGLYGKFIEPNMLIIHDYKITDASLPKTFNGFRVAHISDIHYGTGFNKERLDNLVKNVNDLKPDIVVFTGDLIDEDFNINDDSKKYLTNSLKSIYSKYGKYAVLGNHDKDFETFQAIMKSSDFKLLKNSFDTIYNSSNEVIGLYGFDDALIGAPNNDKLNDKSVKDVKYKIVLVHEPDYVDKFLNDYEISLVLAGHSHGSQVNIPLINKFILPEGSKTYYKDHYVVDKTDLYISNGVGNSIMDFRLFTKPSINIYRLYTK